MRLLLNNNIFYFYRMQPLNPSSLDNNGLDNNQNSNTNNSNINQNSNTNQNSNQNNNQNSKKHFNKTIKNQKALSINNSSNTIIQPDTSSQLTKITGVDDVMKSIFNQNNESINSNGTIFDITNNQDSNLSLITNTNTGSNIQRASLIKPDNAINGPINPSNIDDNIYAKPLTDNLTILNNDNQYIGNTNQLTNSSSNGNINSNDELLQKLNYTIYLLEEQRAQKSNYVTEEIILYIFLGIFIIFILDKFRQPGKYTR